MRITFLGTGTSAGVPVIACECATCHSTDSRDRRWRPSIQLTLDDDTVVLVDASPDLRAQALRLGLTRVDTILLTHSHADHVLGLDDVRIFNFRQKSSIPCLGNAHSLAQVRKMFGYVFDRETPRGGGLPQLILATIAGPFCLGRETVIPIPLLHGTLPVFGFRVGKFAYLTDCNKIPDDSWGLLEELDVLVLDALRHKPHPTHFTLEEAVSVARRIGAGRTLFTHMTHDLPHRKTCETLSDGMSLAYDGLTLDVAGGSLEHLLPIAMKAISYEC